MHPLTPPVLPLNVHFPDSSTQIVEAVWPTSSVLCRNENGSGGVLPLRTFIQETLRRSRTSYSTLQVALYYLILIKPHVPNVDFTMEQPDDCHASRALQCGRRMFLAALILASKYLQDRNYSARAWSKISGLNTREINQNEMAFVTAVNWKLHITDEVYNRWTDCVMKHTPSQPPSPGGSVPQREFDRQCEDFKTIILNLTPELDNLDEILSRSPTSSKRRARQQVALASARSLKPFAQDQSYTVQRSSVQTAYPMSVVMPTVMEPTPVPVYTPGRLAPALGLLPTPRMTPQTSAFSTPAASAASYILGKPSSMSLAMGQLNSFSAAQCVDRWAAPTTPPQHCPATFAARRSSLANTVSTASSPESMVSDSSRTSRSSSISSASSLVSAPSTKLDVLARCRYAKQCSERMGQRPTIASVPEDYEENQVTASPESYTGTVGKDLCDLSIETPLARQERDLDDAAARNSENDAARALQELHNYQQGMVHPTSAPARAGSKRSRTVSIDSYLQDNVRDMLAGKYPAGETAWADTLVRPRFSAAGQPEQVPIRAVLRDGRKRVCCAAEAASGFDASPLYPTISGGVGPGMWEGILN